MSAVKVIFLGTGPSSGVPGVGIGWGECSPDNPRNERTRQSIVVEMDGHRVLVDTTPDLRTQLLREDINTVDAVLYTHAHADHLHGIDDLRGINRAIKKPLPVFADEDTHRQIRERFPYTLKPLKPDEPPIFVRPVLEVTEFVPGDTLDVAGMTVGSFLQDHGYSRTVGFKFGSVVYSTDVKSISEDVLNDLTDARIDVWIIGVFSWREHWTHAHVDLALDWIKRVNPRRAILTHLGTGIDYDALMAVLPEHVFAAFDGMTIDVSIPEGEITISI